MSYPRVNLLRKGEQRYQGAVSRRFILISVVVTPVLLIAVLSGIKLLQYTGVQSELKTNREIWKTLEPKLSLYTEERKVLQENRSILALFEGWKESEAPLVDMMDEIQALVPVNVQFTRFSLRGDVEPAVYLEPEEMKMDYSLQIEGLSQGERAEDEVWKLHKDLLGADNVKSTFASIELASMRKRQGIEGITVREFRILGSNNEGEKQ